MLYIPERNISSGQHSEYENVHSHAYDMGYFEPQERRTKQLTARIPKSVSDGLKDLSRLWTHMEQARTGDKDAEVSISDVVVRLLQIGVEGAWAELGLRAGPKTKEEWSDILARSARVTVEHAQSK